MRFRIEQVFATDPETLCSALVDPDYLTTAMGRLPDISAPVIEKHVRDVAAGTVQQSLRYRFNGSLPSVVTRIVSPERLTWVEDTIVDLAGHTATFRITPVHYRSFFTCSGSWSVTHRGSGSVRVLDGSLKVNSPVPFVGGQVEKAIVSGLRERLDHEPMAFEWWQSRQS